MSASLTLDSNADTPRRLAILLYKTNRLYMRGLDLHTRSFGYYGGGGLFMHINVYIIVTAVRTYVINTEPPTFAFCLQSYGTTLPTLIPERKSVLRLWWCNLDAIYNTNGTDYLHFLFDVTRHVRIQSN